MAYVCFQFRVAIHQTPLTTRIKRDYHPSDDFFTRLYGCASNWHFTAAYSHTKKTARSHNSCDRADLAANPRMWKVEAAGVEAASDRPKSMVYRYLRCVCHFVCQAPGVQFVLRNLPYHLPGAHRPIFVVCRQPHLRERSLLSPTPPCADTVFT